jgi:hypothetical protein
MPRPIEKHEPAVAAKQASFTPSNGGRNGAGMNCQNGSRHLV